MVKDVVSEDFKYPYEKAVSDEQLAQTAYNSAKSDARVAITRGYAAIGTERMIRLAEAAGYVLPSLYMDGECSYYAWRPGAVADSGLGAEIRPTTNSNSFLQDIGAYISVRDKMYIPKWNGQMGEIIPTSTNSDMNSFTAWDHINNKPLGFMYPGCYQQTVPSDLSAWTNLGSSSVRPSGRKGPHDSNTDVWLMEHKASTSTPRVRYSCSFVSNYDPIFFGAFFKSAGCKVAKLSLRNIDADTYHNARFNILDGTIEFASSTVTAKIVPYDDGWYHCMMYVTDPNSYDPNATSVNYDAIIVNYEGVNAQTGVTAVAESDKLLIWAPVLNRYPCGVMPFISSASNFNNYIDLPIADLIDVANGRASFTVLVDVESVSFLERDCVGICGKDGISPSVKPIVSARIGNGTAAMKIAGENAVRTMDFTPHTSVSQYGITRGVMGVNIREDGTSFGVDHTGLTRTKDVQGTYINPGKLYLRLGAGVEDVAIVGYILRRLAIFPKALTDQQLQDCMVQFTV